jgi:hypothetical protein
MDNLPSPGHFHIPGDATRREYAVYVMIARHRKTGEMHLYVGKTGDNKEGCNPVISRAGNHFSFNRGHSQMRNKLPAPPQEFDFDFFYTTFGPYVDPNTSRKGINVINEMERYLNRLVQDNFENMLLNRYEAKTSLRKWQRVERTVLRSRERICALDALVERVAEHIAKHRTLAPVVVEDSLK